MTDRDRPVAALRDPEAPEADAEQLVVGQDARDRRLKYKRWGGFACSLLFIAIALTTALWLPFFVRDPDNKYKIPSKIVVADKRVFLSLGYPAFGSEGVAGGEGSGDGAGELVSFVQLESEASVKDVTIQVVGVDFTERQREDDKYGNDRHYVNILHNDGKNKDKKDHPKDGDDDEDDLEEPGLMFGGTKGETGTRIHFRVGRSKRHPIERAQLRLKITVPLKFDGELSIEGTHLRVESGVSLAQANFSLLHLTAHTGEFILTGSANDGDDGGKEDGDRRSPHAGSGGKKRRDNDEPVLRVSTLNALITHKGSISVGPLKSAVSGRPVRARLETQQGDVSLTAIATMITPTNKDEPWEYPETEELVYFFNPISHSKGDVHVDIRQGELDDEEEGENGYFIGVILVEADAKEGSVTGRVDLNDYQLASINANSYADTILEVADLFFGEVAVTSSHSRKATILQKDDSESVIRYSHSEPSKKLGHKGFPDSEDDFSLGNVGLHSTHGSATLIFS
ncbi:hypothetical protein EC957_008896 [Mortierella hygrophila]|uniref:Uncharacterized protein n=1 Tax=Mortierella hygrophila TaxID=979708 RepID=A0A9P6FBM9_9FUNG|nr:hypothetical protein EC957_008896 [Mortierella hygrophila]